jgi:hypothetical protein
MLGIHSAAEELDGVVVPRVDVDVVEHGLVSHALQRKAIELVLVVDLTTRELQADVLQAAAVVGGIWARVLAGSGLTRHVAIGVGAVARRAPVDDDAAPATGLCSARGA